MSGHAEMGPNLEEAADLYRDQFGDCPTIVGLPEDKEQDAADALMDAAIADEPFDDDAAFYKALGLEPPPDDADI